MRSGTTLAVVVALLAASGTVLAGSASDPEIDDELNDVDVQHIVEADLPAKENLSKDELKAAGDVAKAWVHTETADSFSVTVELAKVPAGENEGQNLTEVWAHFGIGELDYHAQGAMVVPPGTTEPEVRVKLYQGSVARGELTGSLDRETDRLTFTVPKQDVGSPTGDDELVRFYVTTHLPDRGKVLDYAPGADRFVLDADADPTALSPTPEATYGDAYPFGQFQTDVASDLQVQVAPRSLEVTAGDQGAFSVSVLNQAPAQDDVQLSIGDAPDDWSVSLEKSQLSLEQGNSRLTTLYVVPSDDAEGQELITLHLTSTLGADQYFSLSVSADQPDPQGTGPDADGSADGGTSADGSGTQAADGGGADASTDGSGEGSEDEEEKGSPAPAGLLVVATVAAAALALTRRRR